ncbi:MAG: UDP-N-acetylmuramate dehydrogenase [Planctomycetota bacterium]|nr:UDP-N-acetylmuramate dehydrogenase [Planctomycetota bacterium]
MKIHERVSLANHSWYRIGGEARHYGKPRSIEELTQLGSWAFDEGLPIFCLGRGANVLFSDSGFDGLVIHTKSLTGEFTDLGAGIIEVLAGQDLEKLIPRFNALGYQGLEGFVGIPATIGGAVWGNAGTASQGIGELVSEVELIEPGGKPQWVDQRDLNWHYRYSGIEDRIVSRVRLHLQMGAEPQELENRSQQVLRRKKSTQPFDNQTCGCIFRNPDDDSAGRLIEQCQLKGKRVGGAKVSEKHANFIENVDGTATSADIEDLINLIHQEVQKQHGVELKHEVIRPGVSER